MNTPALDKLLAHHERTCTWFIFSGDRHCSCGRDAAREELAKLKATQVQLSFPVMNEKADAGDCVSLDQVIR